MELVMRLRNSDFGLRIEGKNGVVPLRFDLNRQIIPLMKLHEIGTVN